MILWAYVTVVLCTLVGFVVAERRRVRGRFGAGGALAFLVASAAWPLTLLIVAVWFAVNHRRDR